ncbi:hypothetical protein [Methylosinus sp. PW1]|uniref:hypothetical protein n=1 Tax=Methylosinus sp. PW1 TaxID=107636 RepID=UPI00055DEF45|nr:hypothetical protein [Methylosinus sp. PW1]
MLSVIGVHAGHNAKEGDYRPAGAVDLTWGHAWLSMHYTNGRSNTIGLWQVQTNGFPRHVVRDPGNILHNSGITDKFAEKFEVEFDLERRLHYVANASRYYGLYKGQQSRAVMALGKFTGWRLTHNCATWATEKLHDIFGVDLKTAEVLGLTNTPRALANSLRALEAKRATSVGNPVYVGKGGQ